MQAVLARLIPAPALPLRRPRHERLLLILVAAATLVVIQPTDVQDTSRMCLTRALEHGKVSADNCLAGNLDLARFGGHLYSDKAPGVSALALPAAALVRLPPPQWKGIDDAKLWLVRLSTAGVAFLLCAFLAGRLAEGLSPGWGGVTLVTFATGTLMSSLAAANFDEVPAAAFGFTAFLLAWRRRPGWAGLAAGASILVEYQAGLIAAAVGLYVALLGGRPLARYALGMLPGLGLLAVYDRLAFGSPFHLSYRYVAPHFAKQQAGGFFGIHLPHWHAIHLVLVGNRGLIVDSPVLVLAPVGLLALWRRGFRAEAALCTLVTGVFLLLEFGYYDPYGGASPGPRFLIPALPFLAAGLGPTFSAWPRVTLTLAAVSVLASTAILVTWVTATTGPIGTYPGSVWRGLLRLVQHGSDSNLARWAAKTLFGPGHAGGPAMLVLALAALAIAFRDGWATRGDSTRLQQ